MVAEIMAVWTIDMVLLCVCAGHGVGAALNVHEGPQSISTRYWITTPLQVRKPTQCWGDSTAAKLMIQVPERGCMADLLSCHLSSSHCVSAD